MPKTDAELLEEVMDILRLDRKGLEHLVQCELCDPMGWDGYDYCTKLKYDGKGMFHLKDED